MSRCLLLRQTCNLQLANADIIKTNLACRPKPRTIKKIKATTPKTFSPSIYSLLRFNRRKYLRRIVWLLLAIASIVFSIIIF